MPLDGLQLGRYRLLNTLGSGGMGEVYLAEDTHIHRQVAIKIVRSEATPYPNTESARESERLFRREIRAIATLDHPHILPLFDYGEEKQQDIVYAFMVMPLRKEGSLAQWLRQRSSSTPLTPHEVSQIILQAARALQYAHQHQIIHQDVKPSNFLVRQNDEHPNLPDLLLADFGIAKFHTATASMSQAARGTPSYMAPEQWSGHPVPATDQYALAVMSYLLLTGNLPFQGRQEQMMYQHFQVTPLPPSLVNHLLSAHVDKVILQAMAKKPEERFPSILDFALALQQALQTMKSESDNATTIPPIRSGMLSTPNARVPSEQELRATLAITALEAYRGTIRILTLPGGKKVHVEVPALTADGDVIRLPGGGSDASLTITISVKHAEDEQVSPHSSTSAAEMTHAAQSEPSAYVPPTIASHSQKKSLLQHQVIIKGKTVLIGLVALIVIGSLGTFYFTRFNYLQRMSLLNDAIPNPYPPQTGKLALNDPLRDNSNGYFWYEGAEANANCFFSGAAYHVTAQPPVFSHSCGADGSFTNFAYEVQMTIIKGDGGGIIFRQDAATNSAYYFGIGQDGSYQFALYSIYSNGGQTLKEDMAPDVIHTGPGQKNVIAVVANGADIELFVNQQLITSITDTTYNQGQIAVAAETTGTQTEVAFSNARVWTL